MARRVGMAGRKAGPGGRSRLRAGLRLGVAALCLTGGLAGCDEVERVSREKPAQEKLAQEQAAADARIEAEALRKQEAAEAARRKRKAAEAERRKQKAAEAERRKREAAEAERRKREAAEAERRKREAAEAERRKREAAEAERRKREAAEAERRQRDVAEAKRREREAAEAARRKQEDEDAEKRKRESEEAARREREAAASAAASVAGGDACAAEGGAVAVIFAAHDESLGFGPGDIASADAYPDPLTGGWAVALSLCPSARERFHVFTRAHVGERVALRIGGETVLEPTLVTPIADGELIIDGYADQNAAQQAARRFLGG